MNKTSKKLSFTNILDSTIEVYSKEWKKIFKVAYIFAILPIIQDIAIQQVNLFLTAAKNLEVQIGLIEIIIIGIILIITLLFTLSWGFSTISMAYLTDKYLKKEKVTWKEAVGFSLAKWKPLFKTMLISSAMGFILSLFLIVPGIVFMIFTTFGLQIVILRDKAGIKALNYSKEVVTGHAWRVFWFILIMGVASLGIQSIAGYFIVLFPNALIQTILRTVVETTIYAFVAIFNTIFFLRLESIYISERVEE